jgi:hypothetical protein
MKKKIVVANCIATVLLLLPFAASGGQAKPADPAATVKAFYTFHYAHKFDYSARGLLQRRKWLDDNLYKLLVAEVKKPVPKGDAPDLDGDPFTNSQDPPNTFRLGNTKETGNNASVEVIFVWKDKGKVVEERPVEIVLAKSQNLWKIANIISSKDADGDLLKFLKHTQ